MEIHLKDTLRTLRRKKNITQEALADHLGITPQSVGKWERGEGFPDITLLPKIAFYFDVTVDELLDVGRSRIEERIKAYKEESAGYKHAGENEKNLALWERAFHEFPNDCRVMAELMAAVNRNGIWPCPEDAAERIIYLGERILAESNDLELRESAIHTLCYTYKSLGNDEKAVYYAAKGGSFYTTREEMLSFVQEGEEGVIACQSYLLKLLETAARIAAYELPGKDVYNKEEEIQLCRFSIDLLKMPFPDGNVGFYANTLSRHYSLLALEYASVRDEERTLEALENAKKYALAGAEDREMTYTGLLVNRLKNRPADYTKNYKGNACDLLLEKMERKVFDLVREDTRFTEMERELRKGAEAC